MLERNRNFQLLYPDVLGEVTGGIRIDMGQLQCALGIFPRQAFISQPFEALVVLQNMVNQPMQVKVAVRLPNADKKGAPAIIDTPKPQMALTLQPGEVGILHLPMIAQPPTQPGKEYPVRAAIRFRVADNAAPLRPASGGAPAAALEISPYKLHALREVDFKAEPWGESNDILTGYFDLAPHRLTDKIKFPDARYEPLWTRQQMPKEQALAQARIPQAHDLADGAAHPNSYGAFLAAVNQRFSARGFPLLPGEAAAIAKMMTYTLDDAPRLEQFAVDDTRWFTALCQVLAAHPELLEGELERGEIIAHYVFHEVLYEAVLMGFHVLEHDIKDNLGSQAERRAFADQLLGWLAGRGEANLNYVLLPLVLGGLSISRLVRSSKNENPWDIVDGLTDALHTRLQEADDSEYVVLHLLDGLLTKHTTALRSQRINRP
ncbi:MAG: hypothetical protein H7Y11_10365 [Armatimonadetes bacterium]|nr:hypothetical protein [Anaerolineae bacterium]